MNFRRFCPLSLCTWIWNFCAYIYIYNLNQWAKKRGKKTHTHTKCVCFLSRFNVLSSFSSLPFLALVFFYLSLCFLTLKPQCGPSNEVIGIYIYVVKLLIGPSLGVFKVMNWAKSKLLTGPRSFWHYKNRGFRHFFCSVIIVCFYCSQFSGICVFNFLCFKFKFWKWSSYWFAKTL